MQAAKVGRLLHVEGYYRVGSALANLQSIGVDWKTQLASPWDTDEAVVCASVPGALEKKTCAGRGFSRCY